MKKGMKFLDVGKAIEVKGIVLNVSFVLDFLGETDWMSLKLY